MSRGRRRAFLVRNMRTGQCATVVGHSRRGALAAYLVGRGLPPGVHFEVKPRLEPDEQPTSGDDEWEEFVTTK